MIDHEFTRPVIFAGGRSLSHLCQGRTQPRNDIWMTYQDPHGLEGLAHRDVSMVFCWSCLTLFVHEASREAYLAWVAGPWAGSVRDRYKDSLLKCGELDRTRPDSLTARLEKAATGPSRDEAVEGPTDTYGLSNEGLHRLRPDAASPKGGVLLVDHDAFSEIDEKRVTELGWTVIRKRLGRSVTVLPSP